MRQEILILKGRLTEARRKLTDLELLLEGLLADLRMKLDPYEDLYELEVDKIRALFEEFYQRWREAKELRDRVRKWEEDLSGL